MKKSILISFLILANLFAFSQQENIPLLTVYGESVIKVTPDYVVLGLRINKEIKLNADGKTTEFAIFNKKDSKISLFNFEEEGIFEGLVQVDSSIFIKEVFITISDLSKFEKYLLDLHNQGFTDFFYVDYRISNVEKHKADAVKLAVQSAKDKAVLLTSQFSQSIGKVHNVTEIPVENLSWYNLSKESLKFKIESGNYLINPGLISIRSKIKVSFDLLK